MKESSDTIFRSPAYDNITKARLNHLASLGLPVDGKTVLALGAGIGELSDFFIERAKRITIVEGREENIELIQRRFPHSQYPHVDISLMDLEVPGNLSLDAHDITFAYGILYHLSNPLDLLQWAVSCTSEIFLLETCVSNTQLGSNLVTENIANPSQALHRDGCRPDRKLLFEELQKLFPYVYLPRTQPKHEQFPLSFSSESQQELTRTIYIASRKKLVNPLLSSDYIENYLPHAIMNPSLVEVETVNVCNAKCAFCISKDRKRQRQVMESGLYEKCAREIAEVGCEDIVLIPLLGDPLLDPNYTRNLEIMREKNKQAKLRTNTNLIAMSNHRESLPSILSNLDLFDISIAPNRHEYKQLFGVDRFETVLKQLKLLASVYVAMENPAKVRLHGRALSQDFELDPRLEPYLEMFTLSGWTTLYMDWGGELPSAQEFAVQRSDKSGIPVAPCEYAFAPNIAVDGVCSLCACAGASQELVIGDMRNGSFPEIVASGRRLSMVLSFLDGDMPAYCQKCSFYKPHFWSAWATMAKQKEAVQPKLETMSDYALSKIHHFGPLSEYAEELYGKQIDPRTCDLKVYQDLLTYAFIKKTLPRGAGILEVGGGNSRVLAAIHEEYECWNIDKFEGAGNGPKTSKDQPYRLVKAYMGDFTEELPDDYFDFVFSISALEHVEPNNKTINKRIMDDIDRVLKPGGVSLHTFDAISKRTLEKAYYDYIFHGLSMDKNPLPDWPDRFGSRKERTHGGSMYVPSIIEDFFNHPESVSQMPSFDEMQFSLETWGMSREAFDRSWKKVVKREYIAVGIPFSLNACWVKARNN